VAATSRDKGGVFGAPGLAAGQQYAEMVPVSGARCDVGQV
jgi:hypothetical protein